MAGNGGSSKASTSKLPAEDGSKKISQRPSWSCTACTKKKIKCQKIIPCQQCITRGKRDECRLAEIDPALPQRDLRINPHQGSRIATESEFDSLRESVVAIRQRLFHLETAMSAFVPELRTDGAKFYAYRPGPAPENRGESEGKGEAGASEMKASSSAGGYGSAEGSQEREPGPDTDGDVEAAVTLEFLALGRDRKEDHFNRAVVRRTEDEDEPPNPTLDGIPSLSTFDPFLPVSSLFPTDIPVDSPRTISPSDNLPEKSLSDKIVRFSLDFALWQHCSVHPASFLAECDEFFSWQENRGSLVNQAWLALYFSILCTGTKHMSPTNAAECGISPADLQTLPKQYYDSSVVSLNRANFMAKHSFFSVQCIAVLSQVCLDIGGVDFVATLLNAGIRIAQNLGLHRFSSDFEWEERRRANGVDPTSPAGVKGLITREIRKRVWAALVTEDWFGAAYRRPPAISERAFTTPPPANCHDDDLSAGTLISRPMETPTIVTKLLLTMNVSACIRRFFESFSASAAGSTNADLCREVDLEIQAILRTAPSFMQPETDLSGLHPFIAWLRRYFLISTSHKRLVVHRTFVGKGRKGEQFAYSKKAMVAAAENILVQFTTSPDDFQHVWTLPYHAVVAATTLVLSLFQNSHTPDPLASRALLLSAMSRLQKMQDYSPIAVRGTLLLTTLLAEEASRRRGTKRSATTADLTPSEDLGSLAKRVSSSLIQSPRMRPHGAGGGPSPTPSNSNALTPHPAPTYSIPSPLTFSLPSFPDGVGQDSLDWLLANPVGESWPDESSGEEGGGLFEETGVDFWKLLDGGGGVGSGADDFV